MLKIMGVVAFAVLIAGASTSALAKSHKARHHQAPGYDSTAGVGSDGFAAKPWLGAPYDSQRQLPPEISAYIF